MSLGLLRCSAGLYRCWLVLALGKDMDSGNATRAWAATPAALQQGVDRASAPCPHALQPRQGFEAALPLPLQPPRLPCRCKTEQFSPLRHFHRYAEFEAALALAERSMDGGEAASQARQWKVALDCC